VSVNNADKSAQTMAVFFFVSRQPEFIRQYKTPVFKIKSYVAGNTGLFEMIAGF
jgi:hypothetical protein